jgi:hypothetical protein
MKRTPPMQRLASRSGPRELRQHDGGTVTVLNIGGMNDQPFSGAHTDIFRL